jgi:hypothetical protein
MGPDEKDSTAGPNFHRQKVDLLQNAASPRLTGIVYRESVMSVAARLLPSAYHQIIWHGWVGLIRHLEFPTVLRQRVCAVTLQRKARS